MQSPIAMDSSGGKFRPPIRASTGFGEFSAYTSRVRAGALTGSASSRRCRASGRAACRSCTSSPRLTRSTPALSSPRAEWQLGSRTDRGGNGDLARAHGQRCGRGTYSGGQNFPREKSSRIELPFTKASVPGVQNISTFWPRILWHGVERTVSTDEKLSSKSDGAGRGTHSPDVVAGRNAFAG